VGRSPAKVSPDPRPAAYPDEGKNGAANVPTKTASNGALTKQSSTNKNTNDPQHHSVTSSKAVRDVMLKVKHKLARCSKRLEWSSWLVIVEVGSQLVIATDVFQSSATAFGLTLFVYINVFTFMAFLSVSIVHDLASN
jgi:hypothetical protein